MINYHVKFVEGEDFVSIFIKAFSEMVVCIEALNFMCLRRDFQIDFLFLFGIKVRLAGVSVSMVIIVHKLIIM
jgi:hypothetical protein